ncbi:MAG: methyltransferase domain-containing protein [Kofleriaceae bacterium]|nr:methyltransferase domain-containing protein [Kofleriaceae bacterium]MCL4227800.1 methyltransferase domain-containing protein [Myxococcales bacterium]
MDPHVLPILRCPRCATTGAFEAARGLVCGRCGLAVDGARGFYDLLDVAGRGEPAATTAEQRFMESELVARVYERLWRPTFVRMLAGRGAGAAVGGFAGEMFIHKAALSLDDRAGPWLDLSCGPGLFTRAIAAGAPGALVVGLDISRAMLEVAAGRVRGYTNVVLVRADAHQLPFGDDTFEGLNNAGAIHAYDDAEQCFREIWRVLRPGGLYVGSTFAEAPTLGGRLAARVAGIRRYDPGELRAQLSRLGFAEYEDLRLGGAFVFRARKP